MLGLRSGVCGISNGKVLGPFNFIILFLGLLVLLYICNYYYYLYIFYCYISTHTYSSNMRQYITNFIIKCMNINEDIQLNQISSADFP